MSGVTTPAHRRPRGDSLADLSADIAAQAVEPITSAGDGQSATGRAIGELIAADQYGAAKAAVRKRRRGLSFSRLVAPGALPDCGRAGASFDHPGGL